MPNNFVSPLSLPAAFNTTSDYSSLGATPVPVLNPNELVEEAKKDASRTPEERISELKEEKLKLQIELDNTKVNLSTAKDQVGKMQSEAIRQIKEESTAFSAVQMEAALKAKRESGRVLRRDEKLVDKRKRVICIEQKAPRSASLRVASLSNLNVALTETYYFILENANENFEARVEMFPTKKIDFINFFGEETLVWSYSGSTLDGKVLSESTFANIKTPTWAQWYESFSNFMITNLGAPVGEKNDLVIVLEYENYVRIGYLLNFTTSKNAQMPKLVQVGFSLAIHDFYFINDTSSLGAKADQLYTQFAALDGLTSLSQL